MGLSFTPKGYLEPHDSTANAPADIPEKEKVLDRKIWAEICEIAKHGNTVFLRANPSDSASVDKDHGVIVTFCEPYAPRTMEQEAYTIEPYQREIIDENGELVTEDRIRFDTKSDAALADYVPPEVTFDTPHPLCQPCVDAFSYYCQYVREYDSSTDPDKEFPFPQAWPNSVIHHTHIASLLVSAELGCFLCRWIEYYIWPKFLKPPYTFARIEMVWAGTNRGVDPVDGPLGGITFAVVRPDLIRNHWNHQAVYQLIPHEAERHKNTFARVDSDPEESPLRRFTDDDLAEAKGDYTGSQQSQALAKKWFEVCRNNADGQHHECNAKRDDWLPSRVLDVESAMNDGVLKLVLTENSAESLSKDFISLSYCWGEGGAELLPLLKSDNIVERQDVGLAMDVLPKTLRDAVEIASWFNVKWIWIDCMCVLQDSTTDWHKEAELMSKTYRNAVLNISCDTRATLNGCFVERNPLYETPLKVGSPQLGLSWWMMPHSRYVLHERSLAPSFSRAWIHRERQLSPRVLHFGSEGISWECCGTYYANEAFPGGAPFQASVQADNKYQIMNLHRKNEREERQDPSYRDKTEIYDTWNRICNSFSAKGITKATDMPVVLSSVARDFAPLLPATDRYLAGHWRATLPQAFLWKTTRPKQSTDGYLAPSWSWMSSGSRVQLHGIYPTEHLLSVVDSKVIPRFNDEFSSLSYADITIRGFLRFVHLRNIHLVEGHRTPFFDLSIREGGRERILGASWSAERGVSSEIDLDGPIDGDELHCFALFVDLGVRQSINCLLIEPVGEAGGIRRFERVGTIAFENIYSRMARYEIKEGYEDDRARWENIQAKGDTEKERLSDIAEEEHQRKSRKRRKEKELREMLSKLDNVKEKEAENTREIEECAVDSQTRDHKLEERDGDMKPDEINESSKDPIEEHYEVLSGPDHTDEELISALYKFDYVGDYSWLEKLEIHTICLV